MLTFAFSAVFAALLSMQAHAAPVPLKPAPIAKPVPGVQVAKAPRCPAGSQVDRQCHEDAAASSKSGVVDDSACPCVKTPAATGVINAPRQLTRPVPTTNPIQLAPAPASCSESGFSSAAMCGGRCVDLRTDVRNCGRCSNQCNSDASCQSGVCAVSGSPQAKGKWVPRVDKNTCPRGSEPYIDEKDGGVKCWVNTN